MNRATRVFETAEGSEDQTEAIEAITDYVDTLEWAAGRIDSAVVYFNNLKQPSEAKTFHNLMLQCLTKYQAAFDNVLSYYSSILQYGSGDSETLDTANEQLSEAEYLYMQAQYEYEELGKKLV